MLRDDIRKYPRAHKIRQMVNGHLKCTKCLCFETPPMSSVLRCPNNYDLKRRWFDTRNKCFRVSKMTKVAIVGELDANIDNLYVFDINPRICPELVNRRGGTSVNDAIFID